MWHFATVRMVFASMTTGTQTWWSSESEGNLDPSGILRVEAYFLPRGVRTERSIARAGLCNRSAIMQDLLYSALDTHTGANIQI